MLATTRGIIPAKKHLLPAPPADRRQRAACGDAPMTASSTSAPCRAWRAPWKILPGPNPTAWDTVFRPWSRSPPRPPKNCSPPTDGCNSWSRLTRRAARSTSRRPSKGSAFTLPKASAGPTNRWCTTPPTGSPRTCRSRRMRPTSSSTGTGPISAASRLPRSMPRRLLPQGDGSDRLEAALGH